MSKETKRIIIDLSVSFLIGAIVFALVFFLRHLYDYGGASDACFAAGASLLFVTLLIIIERTGVFDVAFYGFYRLAESFRPDGKKKYDSAYEFKEMKRESRDRSRPLFWPPLSVGGLFMVLALVFLLIYHV
jgi:hypothetical protein